MSPWIRKPESVEEVVVCLDPKNKNSDAVLRSACSVASRVRAIHVPRSKNWRNDPSVSEMFRKASALSPPTVSVDVNVIESSQSVKRTIVNQLELKQPDLCVIGAESKGSLASIFSTVQYVLKNAPCDVLVVRDDGLSALTNGDSMKAIVCFGINDWEGSIDALERS